MERMKRRGDPQRLVIPALFLVSILLVYFTNTSPEWAIRSLGVGLAGGLAGGLIAGAIGLVSVPLITIFLGLPIHQAVATNLFQTIFTAASGAHTHQRLGNVNTALAVPLLIGSLVGAPLGALTGLALDPKVLQALFVVILLAMALNLIRLALHRRPPRTPWWRRRLETLDPKESRNWFTHAIEGTFRGHTYRVPRHLLLVLGAAIGYTSGLLGIGGGFLVTPLVSTVLQVPTHLAIGTGLVVISGNSLFGTLPHLLHGNVLIVTGTLLSLGGAIGARIGSRLSHHLDERALRIAFVLILLIVAWRMSPW
jgi:uncharacterized protein